MIGLVVTGHGHFADGIHTSAQMIAGENEYVRYINFEEGMSPEQLAEKFSWVMAGLGAAGGMMRFVGFATLLRIMLSNEFWGIYFAGFALATIIGYIPELSGSALLLIAFVGIAIALYDYQTRVAIKQAAGSGFAANGGDDEDGI